MGASQEPAASAEARRTFLFTDLEGSTALWEREPARMRDALGAHDALARAVVAAHGGAVVKMAGDGVHAAFADAPSAVSAALAFQQGLHRIAQRQGVPLRARCGLHAGACEERDGDYFGTTVNRAARIMGAASGGQVLLSATVAAEAEPRLPAGARLTDLGHVRLRDLARAEHLFELGHADLAGPFPPLRSLDATPHNLPFQLTSFLGRDAEIGLVRTCLQESRLVTITGAGGMGKTRLALHAAAETMHRYPDGTWFVDLAPLADGARVEAAVAQAAGVREDEGPLLAALARHFAQRRALVLLDNCEHVLDACAALAAALLAAAPGLAVLATSREPLGVAGERLIALAPLPVPEGEAAAEAPAIRLFVERARDQHPGFAPDAAGIATLVDIVRRLEGIPLAVELAAARTRALTLDEISERLSDRFRLLSRGYRGTLPRQRTLEALIAWSYDLLAPGEQRLFAALAVFAGGFDDDGVQAVCGTGDGGADGLESLVAKSLVVAAERGGRMRYRMLDTIREFAQAKLAQQGGGDALRERHARWCVALARGADEQMPGPRQGEWIDRLETEIDNLRAALAWTCAQPALHEEALTLAAKLWRFWHMTGRMREGRQHVERALACAAPDASSLARADALYGAAALAKNQNDFVPAVRLFEEAAALYRAQGRERSAAAALGSLGNVRQDMGDLGAARALHEQALALFRRVNDRVAAATALLNLGAVALDEGDHAASLALHEEALAEAQELGLGAVACMAELNLGQLAMDRDDMAAAGPHLARALDVAQRIRFRVAEAMTRGNLAAVALAAGDRATARAQAHAALALLVDTGSQGTVLDSLDVAADVLAGAAPALAAQIVATTAQARAALAMPVLSRTQRLHARVRERAGDGVPAGTVADAVAAALAALAAGG